MLFLDFSLARGGGEFLNNQYYGLEENIFADCKLFLLPTETFHQAFFIDEQVIFFYCCKEMYKTFNRIVGI